MRRIISLVVVALVMAAMMLAMAMPAFAQAPHKSCKGFGIAVARFALVNQGQGASVRSNPPETTPQGGIKENVELGHERFCEPA